MKSTVAQAIGVAMLLVVGSLANPLFADSGSYPGCAGEACDAVGRGLLGFIDRNSPGLHGNGRSCADCHSPLENFQLSPNGVQFRWNLLQLARRYNPKADDPLFRPIDADDFRVNGQAASDFTTLRGNALVRITLQLPANLKLVDPASIDPQTGLPLPGGPQYLIDPSTGLSYSYVDVARMVPSVNNVALTGPDNGAIVWPRGPNPAGGYQLDARAGTLPDQALGAFVAHAEVQSLPGQQLLDDIGSFQRTLFSSPGVARLAAAVRDGVTPLPDPDPVLTPVETQGKAVFIRACGQCHGGPGQSTPQLVTAPPFPPGAQIGRYFDINVACPRPVDRKVPARYQFDPCPANVANKAKTYEIALPNIIDPRTGQRLAGARGEPVYKPQGDAGTWFIYRASSDPGRALLTGNVGGAASNRDDWQKLDINPVRGVARTAPYFHNNSALTLLQMVNHYVQWYKKQEADLRDAFNFPPFFGNPPFVPPDFSTDAVTFNRMPKPEEVDPLIAYLKKL